MSASVFARHGDYELVEPGRKWWHPIAATLLVGKGIPLALWLLLCVTAVFFLEWNAGYLAIGTCIGTFSLMLFENSMTRSEADKEYIYLVEGSPNGPRLAKSVLCRTYKTAWNIQNKKQWVSATLRVVTRGGIPMKLTLWVKVPCGNTPKVLDFALLNEEAQKQKLLAYLVFASREGSTALLPGALVSELTPDSKSGAPLKKFLKEEVQKEIPGAEVTVSWEIVNT